jgi:AraC-like DNA-binding protein/mannose-6-phosphate isomerase-like protein (cupin superfamily)
VDKIEQQNPGSFCLPQPTHGMTFFVRPARDTMSSMKGPGGCPSESVISFLESLSFDGATVKFCERFDGKSRIWNFRRHSHPYFELIFFIEGKAKIDAGPDVIDISLFDVLVYPPGLLHKEQLDGECRQEIICMWVDLGPCPAFDHAIKLKDLRGTMRELFEIIYLEFTGNRAFADDVIASCLRTLFLLIKQSYYEPSHENDSQVERCLSYIHEHYTANFDSETLAQTISVSPSYLFRIFKRKMQVTPMHYRNLVRIDKAKLLLLDRRLTMEEIAWHVGFEDSKYFSRIFKKEEGLSPSEFRAKHVAE